MIDLLPESPTCIDIAHRTPLHVAVGTRANLSTIELLMHAYPDACAMVDLEGKTPLHLACDGGCKLFESDLRDLSIQKPSIDTVLTLIHACPFSTALEDQDGMSALEYAIISDASIQVVELLQITTRSQFERLHHLYEQPVSEGSHRRKQRKRQREHLHHGSKRRV